MEDIDIVPIQAAVHGIGKYRVLRTVSELAECLMNHFPEEGRGEHYKTALMVCLAVLERQPDNTHEQARDAFVDAAMECGVSVRPDDRPFK